MITINLLLFFFLFFFLSTVSHADWKSISKTLIPDPLVFEVGNSPTNDFSLPSIIRISTGTDIASEIRNGVVRSNLTASNKKAEVKFVAFQDAILQRTRTFNNWFWAINGAGNIYHRLCKYMDLCSPGEVTQAAILQPIIESSKNLSDVGYLGLPNHHAESVKDLMSCFGPLLWYVTLREERISHCLRDERMFIDGTDSNNDAISCSALRYNRITTLQHSMLSS